MKKTFTFILTVILLTSLAACAGSKVDISDVAMLKADVSRLQDELDALKIGGGFIESFDFPPSENPEPEASLKTNEEDIWMVGYYIDSFNHLTDKGYVVNENNFYGVFSNSATTNSRLDVKILADTEKISIILYEYGRNMVINSSSRNYKDYEIIMRTPDDTRYIMWGSMPPGNDRIFIDIEDNNTALRALCGAGTIDFYIDESERTTTHYVFRVPASNFADVYELLN